jgi:hypothetical protein
MPAKPIPHVSVTHANFASLTQSGDGYIIQQFRAVAGLSRKKIFPKSVKYNQCRVSRGQNQITIQFCLDGTETARFSFVPIPPVGSMF